MAIKLFVGSLPYNINDDQLEELFASFGTIASAKVIIDRDTGRSKGFGFVEFEDDESAKTAIKELDGKQVEGRTIVVNEARPQEKRAPRPYGNNGGSFGGNGGDRRGGFNRDRRY